MVWNPPRGRGLRMPRNLSTSRDHSALVDHAAEATWALEGHANLGERAEVVTPKRRDGTGSCFTCPNGLRLESARLLCPRGDL